MILQTIHETRRKMNEQGIIPRFIHCSSPTRKVIGTECKKLLGNTTSDPATITFVDGMEVVVDESLPFMQVVITDQKIDVAEVMERNRILQESVPDSPLSIN